MLFDLLKTFIHLWSPIMSSPHIPISEGVVVKEFKSIAANNMPGNNDYSESWLLFIWLIFKFGACSMFVHSRFSLLYLWAFLFPLIPLLFLLSSNCLVFITRVYKKRDHHSNYVTSCVWNLLFRYTHSSYSHLFSHSANSYLNPFKQLIAMLPK